MDFVQQSYQWIGAHWDQIIGTITALTAFATAIQKWLNHKNPKADNLLTKAIDVLSWIPKLGQQGVFGKVNVPGCRSKVMNGVNHSESAKVLPFQPKEEPKEK